MSPLKPPEKGPELAQQPAGVRDQSLLRLAIGAWAVILLVIGVRVLLRPQAMTVYVIFADAARRWWAGESLYTETASIYRYSPLVTVLFSPFALLPDRWGGLIWRAVNVAVYFGAFAWWLRTLVPQVNNRAQRAALFLLLIPLSVGSINNGQSNPLIIGLLLAGLTAAYRERWNLAAGCLALACLFKGYPLAVGLLLALVYPRRFAWRLPLALGIGLALPFLMQSPDYVASQYNGWWLHMVNENRQAQSIDQWYRDFRLLCHVLHIPLGARAYQIIQLLTAAACAGICLTANHVRWDKSRILRLVLGLACCWMTVFGSAAESSTYILLAPALALSLWLAFHEGQPLSIRLGVLGAYALFAASQAAVWFPFGKITHSLGLHPLAGLLFLIFFLGQELPALQSRVHFSAVRGWAVVTVTLWTGLIIGFAIFGYRFPWSHTVFDIYARATRVWWARHDIYYAQGTDLYRYSPLFAVAISPVALLSDGLGSALWRIANCMIFAGGLFAWARYCWPGQRKAGALAALYLLVLPTSLHSMYIAQANLCMVGACLLGLAALACERWHWAAACLAGAALIKGYPIALAMLLVCLFPRKLAWRFAAWLAVGLALPFLTAAPDYVVGQYASWVAHLRDSTNMMRERLRSIDHLFAIYGQALRPETFLRLQILAGLVALALCLWHARHESDTRKRLAMTYFLFSIWAALFGPATETCTYVIVAPTIAWALIQAFTEPRAWLPRLLLIASLLLMGLLPTDLFGSTIRNFANEHGSQPIGACLLAAYVIPFALRRSQEHELIPAVPGISRIAA
jgi:hypothetical protein